eukprot:2905806-Pleurochrysis_carterae.AAC.1
MPYAQRPAAKVLGRAQFFYGAIPEGALKATTFTNTMHRSIVAADTNNEVGVAGTAGGVNGRSGVLLMHLTVFGRIGNGFFADPPSYNYPEPAKAHERELRKSSSNVCLESLSRARLQAQHKAYRELNETAGSTTERSTSTSITENSDHPPCTLPIYDSAVPKHLRSVHMHRRISPSVRSAITRKNKCIHKHCRESCFADTGESKGRSLAQAWPQLQTYVHRQKQAFADLHANEYSTRTSIYALLEGHECSVEPQNGTLTQYAVNTSACEAVGEYIK